MPNKAILLDARNNTVRFVTINTFEDISKFGKFDIFTCVQVDAKGNTLFVDDEGLLNGTNVGFNWEGRTDVLMGNAIILGTNRNTGDSVDTDLTLEQVRDKTQCFFRSGRHFIKAPGLGPEIVA